MTYLSRPMGNRLGIHADNMEAKRRELGLTPAGFWQDGTDPLKAEKEAMERAMYERADARLPAGIGGIPSSDADDTED